MEGSCTSRSGYLNRASFPPHNTRNMGNVKTLVFLLLGCLLAASAQNCGRQAGGRRCAGGLCCSQYGFCGTTYEYCGPGCQSNCHRVSFSSARVGSGDLSSLIPQPTFEQMLKHRNDASCSAKDFYTYDAFITAAKAFDGFATVGDTDTRKREVAAFFAQSSQETAGGSSSAADGPYAWGYCSLPEQEQGDHPESVSTDATIAFKTALRFWMTPQSSKPSCHDVITGKWTPSDSDKAANRLPGFGVITNIMKGGVECSKGYNDKVAARIGFYKRYCDILGVSYGDNLDCYQQKPFA